MNKDRKGIIYAHRNKINGKMYIGQTIQTLQKRFRTNGRGYETCIKFYRAIQKYGWDNFDHIILECGLNNEEINDREKYWISYYDSVANGYNVDLGGFNMSEEHKEKIKMALAERAREVICVNNKKIYNSAQEAYEITGIHHIGDCCNGKLESAGADENGYALIWRYLDEYDKNEDFVFKKHNRYNEPIICVTNDKVYSCIGEASHELNIDNGSLVNCCKGKRLTAGVDQEGQLLSWRYLYDYLLEGDKNRNINGKQKFIFVRNMNISVNDYISMHLFALNNLDVTEYKLFTYFMSMCYENFPFTVNYIASKINASESACLKAINSLIDNSFVTEINRTGNYLFNNYAVKNKIFKINPDFSRNKILSYNKYSENYFRINNIKPCLYQQNEKLNKIIKNALLFSCSAKSSIFKVFMYILLYFLQDTDCLIVNNEYIYNDIKLTHESVLKGLQYLIEIGYLKKEEYGKKIYYLDMDEILKTSEPEKTETE